MKKHSLHGANGTIEHAAPDEEDLDDASRQGVDSGAHRRGACLLAAGHTGMERARGSLRHAYWSISIRMIELMVSTDYQAPAKAATPARTRDFE